MGTEKIMNITPAHFVDGKGRAALEQDAEGYPVVQKIDGKDSMGNIALALYENMQSLTSEQRQDVIAWVKQYR